MLRRSLLALFVAGCGAGTIATPPGGPSQPPASSLRLDSARAPAPAAAAPAPVMLALQQECERYAKKFRQMPPPRAYFLAYQVTEAHEVEISATQGALLTSTNERQRTLDVDLRVGDYQRDNTNPMAPENHGVGHATWRVPLGENPASLRPTIWLATEQQYRRAKEVYPQVKANRAVRTQGEDRSDDLSREKPVRHLEQPGHLEVDQSAWEKRVRRYSALFAGHPDILISNVALKVRHLNHYFVNSEGTAVQTSRPFARLVFRGWTRTDDGMDLVRQDSIDVSSSADLANDQEVERRIKQIIGDLEALKRAPLADPYVGPAILEGSAAAVYFHEIFGHRVEGHRQKSQHEGQTFAKKIDQRVLPAFIDVYDDPTLRAVNGIELNGFYRVDDEGIRAQRAPLIENGILKGFLMSRSPARGFTQSNGHGRRQAGHPVVARQGNLIVHPRQVTTTAGLKQLLIDEVTRQGKPYGLRFSVVEGGLTNTSRLGAQFFKVQPVMVYRVYPDGREELVRGADIEGTPLTSLSQMLAAADDPAVFNGYCGAESGFVPVSAVSPSLLVGKVEIARKMTHGETPPILPPPPRRHAGGTP